MKQLLKLIEKIKTSGREGIIQHSDLMAMAGSYVDNYEGSWRELALIADRLENLAKTINDTAKPQANLEAVLEGNDGKHEFMGNEISLRTTAEYEYQPDPYITKCEADLEQIAEQIKPLKKKEKAVKDSIKSAQKKQVAEGKAKLVEEKRTIAIKRK